MSSMHICEPALFPLLLGYYRHHQGHHGQEGSLEGAGGVGPVTG